MIWVVLVIVGLVVLLAVLAPTPRRDRAQADPDRPWLGLGGLYVGSDGGGWGGDGGSGGGGDGGGGGGC